MIFASDADIRAILATAQTICLIGASSNPGRASNSVMAFLQRQGHRVIPLNPLEAGKTIHGEHVYGTLADVPAPVQMLDIFRRSEAVAGIVDEALVHRQRLGLRAIWTQLGVIDAAAAERAAAAGLSVVMDRCPAIEYPRLALPPLQIETPHNR